CAARAGAVLGSARAYGSNREPASDSISRRNRFPALFQSRGFDFRIRPSLATCALAADSQFFRRSRSRARPASLATFGHRTFYCDHDNDFAPRRACLDRLLLFEKTGAVGKARVVAADGV